MAKSVIFGPRPTLLASPSPPRNRNHVIEANSDSIHTRNWTLNRPSRHPDETVMSEQILSTELSGCYAWTHTLQGVYYGPGSVSTALPKLLDTLGASKAMVVTGNSLYTKVCLTNNPFRHPALFSGFSYYYTDGYCEKGGRHPA